MQIKCEQYENKKSEELQTIESSVVANCDEEDDGDDVKIVVVADDDDEDSKIGDVNKTFVVAVVVDDFKIVTTLYEKKIIPIQYFETAFFALTVEKVDGCIVFVYCILMSL